MELDRRGAELLFQVLTEREERSAIAIASSEPFSGWTRTFTDLARFSFLLGGDDGDQRFGTSGP